MERTEYKITPQNWTKLTYLLTTVTWPTISTDYIHLRTLFPKFEKHLHHHLQTLKQKNSVIIEFWNAFRGNFSIETVKPKWRELWRVQSSLHGTVNQLSALTGCLGHVVVAKCRFLSVDSGRALRRGRVGPCISWQKTPTIDHIHSSSNRQLATVVTNDFTIFLSPVHQTTRWHLKINSIFT